MGLNLPYDFSHVHPHGERSVSLYLSLAFLHLFWFTPQVAYTSFITSSFSIHWSHDQWVRWKHVCSTENSIAPGSARSLVVDRPQRRPYRHLAPVHLYPPTECRQDAYTLKFWVPTATKKCLHKFSHNSILWISGLVAEKTFKEENFTYLSRVNGAFVAQRLRIFFLPVIKKLSAKENK